jgi:hypothetical protein
MCKFLSTIAIIVIGLTACGGGIPDVPEPVTNCIEEVRCNDAGTALELCSMGEWTPAVRCPNGCSDSTGMPVCNLE